VPTRRETFLAEVRERFAQAAEAEAEQRQLMLEDAEFRAGDQWPDNVKAARAIDQRPCLTIDKLSGPIRQVTNAQRQSRFAIDVVPIDGDPKVAEVFQGLVRHIEVESQAQVAYSWAFEQAVTSGRGFWRVLTDYASDASFDQDLRIARILNPFTVYLDPAAEEADASDARYAFVVEDLPREEFERRYPKSDTAKAQAAGVVAFDSIGDRTPDWFPDGKVRVAEYWWREPVRRTLVQLADGRVVPADQAEDIPVLDQRDVDAHVVKWALVTGAEVLDEREWPGKYIPIVPVVGEELNIGGERVWRGLVRAARDAQRMYNYWISAETEAIALAPRAPFVGVEGQFEGHEAQWKQANLRSYPYLEYKGTSIAGVPVGPPQRQVAEPPIQALVMAIQQADSDIKATTGMFDPSLGNISPRERSGRAILALQRQGETATSNYTDNLARAIAYTGRILVDLIPAIYDRPGRLVRVLGADDQAKTVALNAPFVPGPGGQPQVITQAPAPPGAEQFNLREGRFSVRVQVGQSYTTQRQEASTTMLEVVGANPSLMPLVGDLLFQQMDWPGAQAMAERLKKMLPPALQDDQAGAPVPPQVQAQLQQAGQMVEALTQRVNELTQAIETDAVKASRDAAIKKMELESRERVAAMQVQADLVQTEAQINAQGAQKLLTEQLASIRHLLELQHARVDGAEQRAFEAQQGEATRAYEGEQADAERLYGALTLGAEQAQAQRQAEAAEETEETEA
jgi:hypothetical protein